MLATNRLSPSRPRPANAASSRSGLLFATATDIAGSFMSVDRGRWRWRRGDHIGTGRTRLVFRSGGDLRTVETELDGPSPAERGEVQRFPIDRDLATADTEKPAEIDHSGLRPSIWINQDVNNQSQILAMRAFDLLAQHRGGVIRRQRLDVFRWLRAIALPVLVRRRCRPRRGRCARLVLRHDHGGSRAAR